MTARRCEGYKDTEKGVEQELEKESGFTIFWQEMGAGRGSCAAQLAEGEKFVQKWEVKLTYLGKRGK